MAKELQQFGPTGRTVYATIVVAAGASGGQYFNRNTPGLEAFNSANWTAAKYAVACADTNGVGLYTADVPTGLTAGQYSVVFYTQSGGSPAVGDQPLGGAALVWDGTTVTTISDKTGYSLSQSFPSNFAALGITAGGKVSGVVLADTITTYTGNTPQTGDSYARIGAAGVGLTAVAMSAAGIDAISIESGLNARQALALNTAMLAGSISGATSIGGTATISGAGVSTPRAVMTGSAAGNRTGITLTPPA